MHDYITKKRAGSMHIVFVRHGQGEHNENIPNRLQIEHPNLTDRGKKQVEKLREKLSISSTDLMIVSPTIRTIQTANILTNGTKELEKYISTIAGPRMFPQNPEWDTYPCDRIMDIKQIDHQFPEYGMITSFTGLNFWNEGINKVDEKLFEQEGIAFIRWCESQQKSRIIIVSHDGTINNLRCLLGETGLTRKDFLGEAGCYRMDLSVNNT